MCTSPPLPQQPLRHAIPTFSIGTPAGIKVPSSQTKSSRQGPRYPIFHPQYPGRAEEHAAALHKPTISDPLTEMDSHLQMIKTQLTVGGRYWRLCKGAVQMRSYQDLQCPKHLSILG